MRRFHTVSTLSADAPRGTGLRLETDPLLAKDPPIGVTQDHILQDVKIEDLVVHDAV